MGLGAEPIAVSTSNAAPLVLSRVIAIKEENFPDQDLSPEVIEEIKELLTPRKCNLLPESKCVFQDPIKHRALLNFQLGYRS